STYSLTARICAELSDDPNGGMLLRPYVTVSTAKSTVGTAVSGMPPPCPPLPSSPWHATQTCAKTSWPLAAVMGAAAADDDVAGAAVDVVGVSESRGVACGSVPSRPNSQTLSPCGVPTSRLPAEYATTYGLPARSNTVTGEFMPAPV